MLLVKIDDMVWVELDYCSFKASITMTWIHPFFPARSLCIQSVPSLITVGRPKPGVHNGESSKKGNDDRERRKFFHDFLRKGLKLLKQNEKVTTIWIHESSCLESVRKDSGTCGRPMTAFFFFTEFQMCFQMCVKELCVKIKTQPTGNMCFELEQKSDDTSETNGVKELLVHNDKLKTMDDDFEDLGGKENASEKPVGDFKDLQEHKVTDADLRKKHNKAYVLKMNDCLNDGKCEDIYLEDDRQNREGEEVLEGGLLTIRPGIDVHMLSALETNEEKHYDTDSALSGFAKDHGNCVLKGGKEQQTAAENGAETYYELQIGEKNCVRLPLPAETKNNFDEDKSSIKKITYKVLPNPPNNFERDSRVKSLQDSSPLDCFERQFVKEDQQRRGKKYLTLLESDIALLRKVSWLPMHKLPVPKVEIDVHYVDQFPPLVAIITQIAEGNTPRPQISMRYELLRLCTLRTYPRENKPYLIKLAAAGFYYASDGDGVVCYCCGIRRYGWTEKDDPMAVHKRINQHCKFFKKNAEYNVPATSFGPLSEKEAFLDAIPDCEVPNYSEDVNNDNDNNRQSNQPTTQNRTGLGIQTSMPKHPQYAPKTTRENSYNGWPNTSSHTPIELAEAGFYFAGFGDCVRCFHCGIGLRHWDKEDNVWIEHARWSKDCVFLLQKKGREFVELVQLAVQYTNELEDETGASGTSSGVVDLEKYLVGEAAQFVLTKGFTPIQIKESLEAILSKDSNPKITGHSLLQKVIELHGKKNEPAPEDNTNSTPEPTESTPETVEKQVRGENSEAAMADPKAIKEENEQLKEQTVCKVCLDNTVSIVFLPCGHLVTCADCAPAMRKCPICRAVVKGTVRTYMS